jgi:hypothetical protein
MLNFSSTLPVSTVGLAGLIHTSGVPTILALVGQELKEAKGSGLHAHIY